MKRELCLLLCLGCAGCPSKHSSPQATPVIQAPVAAQSSKPTAVPLADPHSSPFVITGPTVIAFFTTTQAEVDKDADGPDELNEALSDFEFYLLEMTKPLENAHVRVEMSSDPAFDMVNGGNTLLTSREDMPSAAKAGCL